MDAISSAARGNAAIVVSFTCISGGTHLSLTTTSGGLNPLRQNVDAHVIRLASSTAAKEEDYVGSVGYRATIPPWK